MKPAKKRNRAARRARARAKAETAVAMRVFTRTKSPNHKIGVRPEVPKWTPSKRWQAGSPQNFTNADTCTGRTSVLFEQWAKFDRD